MKPSASPIVRPPSADSSASARARRTLQDEALPAHILTEGAAPVTAISQCGVCAHSHPPHVVEAAFCPGLDSLGAPRTVFERDWTSLFEALRLLDKQSTHSTASLVFITPIARAITTTADGSQIVLNSRWLSADRLSSTPARKGP